MLMLICPIYRGKTALPRTIILVYHIPLGEKRANCKLSPTQFPIFQGGTPGFPPQMYKCSPGVDKICPLWYRIRDKCTEQRKRAGKQQGVSPLAEGVTLSGVPPGTRTVRGCDSGEARRFRVPKVQRGPGYGPPISQAKGQRRGSKAPLCASLTQAGVCFFAQRPDRGAIRGPFFVRGRKRRREIWT